MDEPNDHLLLQHAPLGAEFVDELTGLKPTFLGPIGRVNILVGANSAGKSRLLRSLASRKQHVVARGSEAKRVDNVLAILERHAESSAQVLLTWSQQNSYGLTPSTFSGAAETIRKVLSHPGGQATPPETRDIHMVSKLAEAYRSPKTQRDVSVANVRNIKIEDMPALLELTEFVKRFKPESPPRLLIPALRSAHTLWESGGARLRGDIFATTFQHRYTEALDVPLWTGAEIYEALLQLQCAKREERAKKEAFEDFIGRTLFNGKEVELVPELLVPSLDGRQARQESHINFYLEGSRDRELFNVGDGVGAITNLLYPLFTAKLGTWAFIEEPEINLHPAYQRVLVEALVQDPELRARELRIFLTTHSNHLLDVAMEYPDDVAVFSLSDTGEKKQIRRCQGRDIRVLDALGVRNGSVFLANCSIWVEGPSDVIYLRAFLDAAMAKKWKGKRPFQEDLHFTFLEYGGSLLAHYDFADEAADTDLNAAAIANRICVVSDRDLKKDAKHAAWLEREKRSNGALRYLTTTGIEIENELSGELLGLVVTRRLRLEEPPSLSFGSAKKTERIGAFLERLFAGHDRAADVAGWRADGGSLTAKAKTSFAKHAAKVLAAEDSVDARLRLMGVRACTLADAVLEFIEKHNPPPVGST